MVTYVLRTEQLLQLLLLRDGNVSDELVLWSVIGILGRRTKYQVPNFGGELWGQ